MSEKQNPNDSRTGVTKIHVEPGSRSHDVLVEENAEPPMPERRHNSAPVNVQVGPPTAGLTGWAATIANMSAVGFVMLMMFFIYQDFRANVKENQAVNREEIKLNRELNERNNQSLVTAMQNQSHAFTAALAGNQSKLDALMLSMQALVSELKADRLSDSNKLEKILDALRALKPNAGCCH